MKSVFHRAVEYDTSARADFLNKTCGADNELRSEVESLLASERAPGSVLDRPVIEAGTIAAASPSGPGDPMVGRTIGNYIVTGELARGGMGIVYRARHVTLPREVVVKCIRSLSDFDESRKDLRSRFRREAHIQSQLDHPKIVRVYEFFAGVEEYFLVMEYVPGSNLRSLIEKQGILTEQQACDFAIQALEGLIHAHGFGFVDEAGVAGVGIIHRDIKPANLLVGESGSLKLTDFGIARIVGRPQSTRTGCSPGTIEYMSPEQIRGVPADARSDLYSLGVTLYEMLTGRLPFPRVPGGSDYELMKAHIETDPLPIRTLNPGISPVLEEIVTRALQKDPELRWQSAADFSDALVAFRRNGAPAMISVPVPAAPQRVSTQRNGRWMVLTVVALIVVTLMVAGFFWFRQSRRGSTPGLDLASIAVLPFADLSPEKNQEYFSEGLTEELRNGLAATHGLRVAGRTSSSQFKDKADDFKVIANKLNVSAILEGTVRKQGNHAKISVELIKAADGYQLWTETFDRDMTDIFAVQEEISRSVTTALRMRLLGEKVPTQAPPSKSANSAAYNAYLQGRFLLRRPRRENLAKALDYFEQAVKLDPDYAPSWVGLGECQANQAMQVYVPSEEGYRNARKSVERALALNPNLATAHAALGWIQQYHDWDWAAADASYKKALALEPWNSTIISRSASLALILGRTKEATELARHAMDIDPLNSGTHHNGGISMYRAGLYEEAEIALKNTLDLSPGMASAHMCLAKVYLATSSPREALAEAEKEPDPSFRLFGMALAQQALGQTKESDSNLKELIDKFSGDSSYQIAEIYATRGQPDRAFEWLDRAYAQRDSGLPEIKADPLMKSLRSDPRYAAWLKKLRLPL